jgi:hypothetical protein
MPGQKERRRQSALVPVGQALGAASEVGRRQRFDDDQRVNVGRGVVRMRRVITGAAVRYPSPVPHQRLQPPAENSTKLSFEYLDRFGVLHNSIVLALRFGLSSGMARARD